MSTMESTSLPGPVSVGDIRVTMQPIPVMVENGVPAMRGPVPSKYWDEVVLFLYTKLSSGRYKYFDFIFPYSPAVRYQYNYPMTIDYSNTRNYDFKNVPYGKYYLMISSMKTGNPTTIALVRFVEINHQAPRTVVTHQYVGAYPSSRQGVIQPGSTITASIITLSGQLSITP